MSGKSTFMAVVPGRQNVSSLAEIVMSKKLVTFVKLNP